MTYSKHVPAAERTMRLLELLAAAPDGLPAGEMLSQLLFSRSALFALLNTLKVRHYIEQDDARGRYRLGPAMWNLLPVRQPGLSRLIEAFRADTDLLALPETAALVRLNEAQAVVIDQLASRQTVRVVFEPGHRQAAHTLAGGLVLLAGLPPGARPAGAAEADVRWRQVQKEGLAVSRSAEVVSLAAPICADGSHPTAALMVSAPAFRASPAVRAELAQAVRQGAARLSYRLGAAVYQPYGRPAVESLGPVASMTDDDIAKFLRGAWGARLACVRQDGTPHVIPLWYEWDGRAVWVTASPDAYWKDCVKESGCVSLTVDEPWPPLRRVLVVGEARLTPDTDVPGGILGLRRRLAARYLGQDASGLSAATRIAGWEAFKIVPRKIIARQGLGLARHSTA